jgi:putative transposase
MINALRFSTRQQRRSSARTAFSAEHAARFEPDVRRVIYTTNPIEALNRQLRKAIKTKGHFPSEEAARKLIYLSIVNATPKWTKVAGWTKALLAFKIHFGDRLPD